VKVCCQKAPDAVKDLPSDDYKGAIGKDGIAIFGPIPDWDKGYNMKQQRVFVSFSQQTVLQALVLRKNDSDRGFFLYFSNKRSIITMMFI